MSPPLVRVESVTAHSHLHTALPPCDFSGILNRLVSSLAQVNVRVIALRVYARQLAIAEALYDIAGPHDLVEQQILMTSHEANV